jgi:hypothetical protein
MVPAPALIHPVVVQEPAVFTEKLGDVSLFDIIQRAVPVRSLGLISSHSQYVWPVIKVSGGTTL